LSWLGIYQNFIRKTHLVAIVLEMSVETCLPFPLLLERSYPGEMLAQGYPDTSINQYHFPGEPDFGPS